MEDHTLPSRDQRDYRGMVARKARLIELAKTQDLRVMIPDALLIHLRGGRLRAYQKTGIDNILKRLKNRSQSIYGRAP